MPRVTVLLFGAGLALAAPASAQVIDLANLSCKDFVAAKKDVTAAIITWLSGYYTKDDDPQVIDFDKVRAKTEKLADYCAKNPSANLLTAAEPILASE
jgi:acid stress chaperone HdeB